MSWIVEEELTELDAGMVEAEYGLSRTLKSIAEKARKGMTAIEEERVLEDATGPLVNYPCKTVIEMVRDALIAYRLGRISASDLASVAEYALREWLMCVKG